MKKGMVGDNTVMTTPIIKAVESSKEDLRAVTDSYVKELTANVTKKVPKLDEHAKDQQSCSGSYRQQESY